MKKNLVKQKLRDGLPSFGTWLSLGNLHATRVLARMGFDWMTLDIEHSAIDWSQAAKVLSERRRGRVDWVRARNRRREKLADLPFFVAAIGLKVTGKKSWTEDYAPLREPPEWL